MRIIVNGQQAFGKAVLEALLDRGEDVVAVYCEPDREGGAVDPLKQLAVEREIPVFQPKSFRKPEVWEQMRELEPDLGVMAYVTLFVPEEALNVPKLGTIQYHPSLLPMHRGPSSINWPIIFGESRTGLSIFWPDNGLDTGPILMQKEIEIGPDDTLGSIYFNHLFPMGVAAMIESVDLVRNGTAPKIVQDIDAGTYEGWCRSDDVEIDWSKPVSEVHNLIRGANPQPGAWTTFKGETVSVFDAKRRMGNDAAERGAVTEIGEGFIAIAADGGEILVERVRPKGGGKVAASEYAASVSLAIGDCFGS
jgi:methionyl-tRNA formyltransferase